MDNISISLVLDVGLSALLVVAALAVIFSRHLLTSTIMLSVYSLIMALLYLILGAPDVAITEAAIGAGISTLLMLAALLLTGEEEKPAKHPFIPLLVVFVVGAGLVYATLDMPAFGDASAVTNHHVASYYLAESKPETGVPNVVTSVLASYRGFDTMGETFVVFTAGMSVMLLLGGRKKKRKSL